MMDALEGTTPPKPTLTEQANWPRIGRLWFVGNLIGAILLVGAVLGGLALLLLRITPNPANQTTTLSVSLPIGWAILAGSLVIFAVAVDLAVRRRHDRDRNGVDCAVILILLELLVVCGMFGLLGSVPSQALLVVTAVAVLYLLVTLVVLGGTKGPNRYGPRPHKD